MSVSTRDLAARYGQSARVYRRYWAPPLIAFAGPTLRRLPVRHGDLVVDLGAGTGAASARLSARAGRGRVVAVDASPGMLAQAKAGAPTRIAADIRAVPLTDGCADAVVTTFVLQHVSRPGRVFAEAARLLHAGGMLATVTWGAVSREDGGPYRLMRRELDRAGAGPDPLEGMPTYHHLVDDPAKVARLATRAGLRIVAAWGDRGDYTWPAAAFVGYASSMGVFGRRLQTLEEAARFRVLTRVSRGIERMSERSLVWQPDIVSLIAVKA